MTLIEIMAKATAGAYGEESELIGKIAGLINAATFDKSAGPFICGAIGKQGKDGMHMGYMICPTYGADSRCTGMFMRSLPPFESL